MVSNFIKCVDWLKTVQIMRKIKHTFSNHNFNHQPNSSSRLSLNSEISQTSFINTVTIISFI